MHIKPKLCFQSSTHNCNMKYLLWICENTWLYGCSNTLFVWRKHLWTMIWLIRLFKIIHETRVCLSDYWLCRLNQWWTYAVCFPALINWMPPYVTTQNPWDLQKNILLSSRLHDGSIFDLVLLLTFWSTREPSKTFKEELGESVTLELSSFTEIIYFLHYFVWFSFSFCCSLHDFTSRCPQHARFECISKSNPNQTHLKQPIRLIEIGWKYTCRCAETGRNELCRIVSSHEQA